MTEAQYDLAIVGGGVVGMTLASALANSGLSLVLIEALDRQVRIKPDFDARTLGLSVTTKNILSALGFWDSLVQQAMPLKNLHISDQGYFGAARFSAEEEKLPAFGYVLEMQYLLSALQQSIEQQKNLTIISPATVEKVSVEDTGVELTLNEGHPSVKAKLLVGADGDRSFIREQSSIHYKTWDYQQNAVITNVTFSQASHDTAFERFTPTGPLAVLPLTGGRHGVVWTCPRESAPAALALSDEDFIERTQKQFGYRLGYIERVGKRQTFPLRLVRAERAIDRRLALVGNAVQSVHPVAAQGLNLGLRDVARLTDVLLQAQQSGLDLGSEAVLKQYDDAQRRDQKNVVRLTDGLLRLFKPRLSPIVFARHLGLMGLDLLPSVRRRFVRQAIGMEISPPKLALGLSLEAAHANGQ